MSKRHCSTDGERIERRSFLKTTGAAGALGALGSVGTTPAGASRTDVSVGETTVLEVGVEHAGVPDVPTNRQTPLAFSKVHQRTGQYVQGLATDDDVRTLRENAAVAVANGHHGLPATLFDDRTTTELVVETNSRLRTSETLPLERRYSTPSVRVEPASGAAAAVAADGRTATVAPRNAERLALDEREIAFRRPGRLNDDGASRVETTTVTPVVKVRNYGRLDTYAWRRGGDPR